MLDKQQPHDLPVVELLVHAQQVRDKFTKIGCQVNVYFKFTCSQCGQRCTFATPNELFAQGECDQCGATTTVTQGGYLLEIRK